MPTRTTIPSTAFTHNVMPIDPDLAREILNRPGANRPVSRATVLRYAASMTAGEWKVTPQGLSFAPDGSLLDGQHRLLAIVESGCTIELSVFFDVDPDVFTVLDQTHRRSNADVLALAGEANPHLLAASLRYLHLYLTKPDLVWTGPTALVSGAQVHAMLDAHPNMRGAAQHGARLAASIGIIPSAAAVGIYVTETSGRRTAADHAAWYTGLSTGAGLASDSPCLALRETMRRIKDRSTTRRRTDTRSHLMLYLHAWSVWAAGGTITRVQLPNRMPIIKLPTPVAA